VNEKIIYLDNAASTPIRPEAIDAMTAVLSDCYGNPSGAHKMAREARRLIDDARERLQHNVGVQSYTRHLNEALEESEKFDVIIALWRIAHASNGVDRFEEHTIRRIADLLYLSHDRFIEAKMLARES